MFASKIDHGWCVNAWTSQPRIQIVRSVSVPVVRTPLARYRGNGHVIAAVSATNNARIVQT
jgi:hypothetical protein